jgi:hypothetical protein
MAQAKKPAAKKSSVQKPTLKENSRKTDSKKPTVKSATQANSTLLAQAKSTAKSTPTKVQKTKTTATQISSAERMKMIAEAAYYLAQARGFSQGNDVNDWITAEQQVEAKLKS